MDKERAYTYIAFLFFLFGCILLLTRITAGLMQNILILQTHQPPTQAEELIQHIEQQIINDLQREIQELREGQDELMEIFSHAETFTITAYAPLDPNAVEGMCYSGNPNVTASGGSPIPYQTVAASREFEFGQRLWVEGVGVVEVNDRGGAIKGKRLDLVLSTRNEALRFGRQRRRVVVL